MNYKLYIPGPVNVSERTLRAMNQQMIGHRSTDFTEMYWKIQPHLQELMYTKDPVYLATSSSWGVMEGAVRNLCQKAVLNCMNGAFSDKWHDVSLSCGKEAKGLKVEWGQVIDPQNLKKELETGLYDTVTIIHNETSTGTMNPIEDLMAVIREFPEIISIVDVVSSFSAMPIKKDALGIDVLLAGVQKALALPPGLTLFSVSERALKRAETVKGRGYYFDFIEFSKWHEKGMTPSTPCIHTIYGLLDKMNEIQEEGLQNRYDRHFRLNRTVRDWGNRHGFELLPKPAYGSVSLNCFKNSKNIDLLKFTTEMKKRYGFIIDGGYGKLKGSTFRISNMGNEDDASINTLLNTLDTVLESELGF